MVARRLVHLLIALAPVYYLLPEDLPVVGLDRWVLLIAFFAMVAAIEAIRLPKGILVFGMRPHEKNQIASFVWAAAGITAALWLFPHDIATATLIGMAFVDPLAGELRLHAVATSPRLMASTVTYLGICLVVLVLAQDRGLSTTLLMSSIGAVVAVASEHFKSRYLDDDFLMLVAPGIVMTALALIL